MPDWLQLLIAYGAGFATPVAIWAVFSIFFYGVD